MNILIELHPILLSPFYNFWFHPCYMYNYMIIIMIMSFLDLFYYKNYGGKFDDDQKRKEAPPVLLFKKALIWYFFGTVHINYFKWPSLYIMVNQTIHVHVYWFIRLYKTIIPKKIDIGEDITTFDSI